MKTLKINQLWVLVALALLLSACQSVQAASLPETLPDPNSRPVVQGTPEGEWSVDLTGPGGGAEVTVSEGVVLATPGVPLDLPWPPETIALVEKNFLLADNMPEEVSQTPESALDPTTLNLPEGVTLYPGSVDPQAVDAGMGITVVYTYTTDAPETVIAHYKTTLASLGYDEVTSDGPDSAGKVEAGWMGNGFMITVSAQPDGERTKILMTVMKF